MRYVATLPAELNRTCLSTMQPKIQQTCNNLPYSIWKLSPINKFVINNDWSIAIIAYEKITTLPLPELSSAILQYGKSSFQTDIRIPYVQVQISSVGASAGKGD